MYEDRLRFCLIDIHTFSLQNDGQYESSLLEKSDDETVSLAAVVHSSTLQ